MNPNDPQNPNPDLHALIAPELEARVVACVLGEASAFETAEIERLCAEQPELAIFQRRIKAVHGLAAKAARPEMQPLQLAPERREKLLQTIGAIEPQTDSLAVASPRPRHSVLRWLTRSYGIAAGVAVIFVLGLLLIPTVGTVRESARRTVADSDARQESQKALIADSEWRKSERIAASEEKRRAERKSREAEGEATALAEIPSFAMAAPAPKLEPPASPSSTDPADMFGETIVEEPFTVEASTDTDGYRATSTLAGTRVRTELRDIGSSVSVATGQFLDDTNANRPPSFLEYTTNTEISARNGSFSQRSENADFALSDIPSSAPSATGPAPGSINSILFGSGQAGGILGGELPPPTVEEERKSGEAFADAYEETVVLSPFEVAGASGRGNVAARALAVGALPIRSAILKKDGDKPTMPPLVAGKYKQASAPDEVSTANEAVSTFSLHVSDVSFRLAQAALARGEAPDPSRIRPEEFYNAFDYGDPAPAAAEKIACRIEQAAHPVLQQRNLVRIAVRVPATGRGAGQPLRLTVLLDTSGSMEREDRVASVRRAMEVLGSLLGASDHVTVIGFARQPRLLVEALPGDQAATQLAELAAQTPAEGGTNLEAALELAITKAQQHYDAPAQNRIVLITDGAANLGNANPERLAEKITAARQQGLAFDACGVGTDGLDDAILEALTRQGDGRYYVLDSPEDADAGFARQLAGAFRPAAQNVKLQVRFNPARVAHYRLIGFEQHRLREEDFRNDKVDAAELAAEEAAVAVYQVAVLPEGKGELGDVFVRFRDTAANDMVERSWTMPFEPRARAFDQATSTVQLAGVAALLAEKLRGGAMADLVRFDELAPVVNALRAHYVGNARVQELVTMVEQARRMIEQ